MKVYKKPKIEITLLNLSDVILASGNVSNEGALDSFNPDETRTIFDGGKK